MGSGIRVFGDQCLCEEYPRLFGLATDMNINTKDVKGDGPSWGLGLFAWEEEKLDELRHKVEGIQLRKEKPDK
ncbi:hypothetical protein VNO78_18420 [Psophocarpus tetragonolobus]|uniref:Uncharacterized protein n=1 Tax=Psophocarpus tetragonolobus TaxID=3891 RepID=A0AAN9SPH1_PSOTE